MALEIFRNQTIDSDVDVEVIGNGIIQVDISGVLGGADVTTNYLDDADSEILVRDCSWMASKGDVIENGADGATKYIQKRKLRFKLINAGELTDINLFVTHETGDIKKIEVS